MFSFLDWWSKGNNTRWKRAPEWVRGVVENERGLNEITKTESCFHHWRKINDRQERATTDSVYLQRCKSHRSNSPSPISFSGESRVQNRPARRPCCHGFISFVQSPTPITCTHTERNLLFRYFPLFFDVKKARKKWKLPSNPPKNWFTFFFLPFLFYFRFVETR